MLLADLVATSQAVAATRSRKAKAQALADALRRATTEELETVVAYLGGTLRQRRTGLGWRGVSDLPAPADAPTLTVSEVHEAFEAISAIAGTGSQALRRAAVVDLFGRATAAEQAWLRGLVTGEVRQGALDAQVQEAVAAVAEVPLAAVRRAAMLAGSTLAAAGAAFHGGEEALAAIGLEVGRPVLPMLASSAPDVAAALDKMRRRAGRDRRQARRHPHPGAPRRRRRARGDPEPRRHHRPAARGGRGGPLAAGRARSCSTARRCCWPTTAARDRSRRPRRARHRPAAACSRRTSSTCCTSTARDLLDEPGHARLAVLDAPGPRAAPGARASSRPTPRPPTPSSTRPWPRATRASWSRTSTRRYEAGRRGAGWIKVKPVHTLDLVVLAVEWGSGRRQGWLSNIHLGARDPDAAAS